MPGITINRIIVNYIKMIKLEVTCVTKPNRDSSFESIQFVGGEGWIHSQAEAIENIQAETHSYFVKSNFSEVGIVVRYNTTSGKPYIATLKNGVVSDNLLKLKECPLSGRSQDTDT